MDICRWTVLNANESISFRWIIVVMIYMATIILCLSSETFDERFYVVANNDNVNTNDSSTSTKEMVSYNFNNNLGVDKCKLYIIFHPTHLH